MSAERPAGLDEAEARAQVLGAGVGAQLPAGWGFILFLARLGEAGFVTYISNLDREGVVGTLEEILPSFRSGLAGLAIPDPAVPRDAVTHRLAELERGLADIEQLAGEEPLDELACRRAIAARARALRPGALP